MAFLSIASTGLIAVVHIYILVLEMFLWTSKRGRKTFKLTAEFAEKTKVLAANQGLYNGFLVAGLIWSLIHPDSFVAFQIRLFFLGCVLAAGLFGGLTVGSRIIFVQAIPATISIALVLLGI